MSGGNKPWLTPPEFCRANRTRAALGLAKKGEIKICVRQGVQVAYGRQAGRAGSGAGLKAWIKTRPAEVAQADHVATSDQALEIKLSDGVNVYFLSDPEGGFCAGGVTDNADPSMKKQLTAEMASMGRPLFFIDPDKGDGVAELSRLYAKAKPA